jgi:hypothetical protein
MCATSIFRPLSDLSLGVGWTRVVACSKAKGERISRDISPWSFFTFLEAWPGKNSGLLYPGLLSKKITFPDFPG